MPKLSVLIPSRNEKYLFSTIRDCFARRQGETEVVVALDGYWPDGWKEITDTYPDLHTVHHGEARGLRPAINSAAASAISRGADYLMKLDAHCLLDDGFDVKLLADIEPNWIVVPRRKRLDPDAWTITETHKPDIDYHYLSFPSDPNDFGGPGLNGKVWEERARERRDKPEYEVDSEMSSQGSAWVLASSYFQKLELMDHVNYGPFWNEAQELFLKCWLSGGRGVINKKTFYAHLHKGTKHGRGYRLPESWLQQGASFTKRWIWNDAWAKQTLPFEWLIDHFWPVPGWGENWREVLYATRKPRVVITGATLEDPGDPALREQDEQFPPLLFNTGEKPHGQGVKADDYVESLRPVDGEPLNIVSARYGILGSQPPFKDHSIDVKERVQSLVTNNSLDIIVNNSTLTPGQNPFRGKKKVLLLTYAWGDREGATVERTEKEWLIIGQAQRGRDDATGHLTADRVEAGLRQGILEPELVMTDEGLKEVAVYVEPEIPNLWPKSIAHPPQTATALNDYLVRKFQISPQRLRAPMPIELRDFHRNNLAQLFAELGFKKGCEVGVAEGLYTEVVLKANPQLEQLLLVDPWHAYSTNPQNKSKEKHEYAMNETRRRVAPYGSKVMMIPVTSMDALFNGEYKIDDESLDWVYVDGNHLFDYTVSDLIWWSTKVRSGGLICGDDFYTLDQSRWRGGGVVEAVNAYVNAHQIPMWFTFAGHKSVDFMWVKP